MSLFDALSKFDGVDGFIVAKPSGELDFHNATDSPDITASVAAAAVQSMMRLGDLLRVGKFSHYIVKGRDTAVVVEKEDRIAAVSVRGTVDAAALVDCIRAESWTFTAAIAAKRPLPPALPSLPIKGGPPTLPRNPTPLGNTVKREAPQAGSIPPTPEAHSLKRLRSALYFGDVSACMPIAKEIHYSEGRSGVAGDEVDNFTLKLEAFTAVVTDLLEGRFRAAEQLDAFLNDETTHDSLVWAAHIWSVRLKLALGEVAAAESSALAAYRASKKFDSDTRTATRCTLADVYIQSEQADKALKVLSSGAPTASRCRSEIIVAAMHLTEAHAWALKRQFAQSEQSAKAAEERFPQSPYPKLMRARSATAVGNLTSARSLYQGVLKLNPIQPDALAELSILERVKEGTLSSADAAVYFHHRELAPTEASVKALRGLSERPGGFPQAAGLLAWRLSGLGDANVESLRMSLSRESSDHRFKPNVVVGYGASCSIAVGYQSLNERFPTRIENVDTTTRTAAVSDIPPTLSLPPSELRAHMAGLSADSLFSGELKLFSLPDILEFLRNAHRTGSLLCSSPNGVGAVELVDGFISSAIAPEVDTIGAILLRDNAISKADLTEAAMMREKDLAGLRIGAILVEKGLVDAKIIKSAVTEQTFASIQKMLSWNEGRFLFTPRLDSDVDRTKVEVKLDSQFLLMELFRRQDEANRVGPRCGDDA